ncbi:MAG: substrate-binding domain-containing protein [Burkholderiaceae bacterium]
MHEHRPSPAVGCLGTVLAIAGILAVSSAGAADLTLLCAGALKAPISVLLAKREASLPHVAVTFATAGAIREKIANGDRPDVVIAPSEDVYSLMKQKLIDVSTRRPLGGTEVGVAVKAGAPLPNIATPDALKATLLAARRVVIVDPAKGTSGRLVESLFKEMHIDEQMRGKTLKVDGGYVVEAVARGEADLGLQQISEILPVAGVKLVGPLPGDLQRLTRYDMAMMTTTTHRADAHKLVDALSSRDAHAVIEKSGFMTSR